MSEIAQNKTKIGLNAFALKLIAVSAMLCDHVAVAFVDSNFLMRAIGRIAFPIFAYFVAEGYSKTRDVKKYAIRLFIFSLIAQVPYALAFSGAFYEPNVIFTLFLGLVAIYVHEKGNSITKIIIPLAVAMLAELIGSDHGAFGVLMVVLFYSADSRLNKLKWAALLIILMQVAIIFQYKQIALEYLMFLFYLIPLGFLYLYNGDIGPRNIVSKWFFYVFYPLHLLFIWLFILAL